MNSNSPLEKIADLASNYKRKIGKKALIYTLIGVTALVVNGCYSHETKITQEKDVPPKESKYDPNKQCKRKPVPKELYENPIGFFFNFFKFPTRENWNDIQLTSFSSGHIPK